jgi:hypothetical protein
MRRPCDERDRKSFAIMHLKATEQNEGQEGAGKRILESADTKLLICKKAKSRRLQHLFETSN